MSAAAELLLRERDQLLRGLRTEAGGLVPELRMRYAVYGDPDRGALRGWNLVFHALTGSHRVHEWWGPHLEAGGALDPADRPLLAVNLPGSCYGSSGAGLRLGPADLALVHAPVLERLGIRRIALAAGGSLGGMVALKWARRTAVPADRVVVFAAPARSSAQVLAWNAAQRMAIEASPAAGLRAARAVAMITYRSPAEFAERFGRRNGGADSRRDMERYLRRHGDKLAARFTAESYLTLTQAMDDHDLGDLDRAGRATAARVDSIIGAGIDSDILFPAPEVRDWVSHYQRAGVRAEYREIRSIRGHDAFLIEHVQVARCLRGEP